MWAGLVSTSVISRGHGVWRPEVYTAPWTAQATSTCHRDPPNIIIIITRQELQKQIIELKLNKVRQSYIINVTFTQMQKGIEH